LMIRSSNQEEVTGRDKRKRVAFARGCWFSEKS
jgi:hypothetical protein